MIEFDEQDFLKNYHVTEAFMTTESRYYKLFLELLKEDELMTSIRFANDVLKVPPLKSFILYHREVLRDDFFNEKMSPSVRRGLGSCFGYLYKFIYGGYEAEQVWFGDTLTGTKTASYFKKPTSDLKN